MFKNWVACIWINQKTSGSPRFCEFIKRFLKAGGNGWLFPLDTFAQKFPNTGTQVNDDQIIATALGILSRRLAAGPALLNQQSTRDYLAMRFAGLEYEVFVCLFLDNRHRVIACEELFRGTIDGANVHLREVVKRALMHNAAAVIFSHNHPSGVAGPSQADQLITRRLKDALSIVEIRVLDHLVVGGPEVCSFAERGCFSGPCFRKSRCQVGYSLIGQGKSVAKIRILLKIRILWIMLTLLRNRG